MDNVNWFHCGLKILKIFGHDIFYTRFNFKWWLHFAKLQKEANCFVVKYSNNLL